jgi:lactate 2-monooxygenase
MDERTPNAPATEEQPIGVQWQRQIFGAGIARIKPNTPISFEELEQMAREKLSPEAFGYVWGSAGAGDTTRANRAAFQRWQIVPRFLRDVSRRDLSVQVLGQRHSGPVFIGPVGVQGILHPDGELATARAAKKLGVPMVLSTVSSTPMEKVAEELGDTPRWFQLYWPGNQEICLSFLNRAAAAGYSALVLTLDSAHLGWREVDLQQGYNPFVRGDGLANFLSDPVFRSDLNLPEKLFSAAAVMKAIPLLTNPAITWADLKFLREHTKLPLVLKGILHPDDARRAVDEGAAGIIVSNHGGRQVDGSIAALEALVRVVEAVGSHVDVMFDSGIRRGADVCKAIGLGAKCVFLGRPYCYGLGLGGEDGVVDVLRNLLADVDLTLGLSGGTSLADLRKLVVSAP